ncbi:nucleotide exchange factor GrpE [Halocatena salina]|nr:nucleotide exchange factor GrpE [Halocatena salina]
MSNDVVLGIDLGAMNSTVGVMETSGPKIITDQNGVTTIPSTVALPDDGEPIAGTGVKQFARDRPDRSVRMLKPHLGEPITVTLGDNDLTPESLTAVLLRTLTQHTEATREVSVDQAVMAVPSLASNRHRSGVHRACELADLALARVGDDACLAGLGYGWTIGNDADRLMLICDLGAATFDVALMRMGGGVYEFLATAGDLTLGGDDWTWAIVEWLLSEFAEQHDASSASTVRNNRYTLDRLYHTAETVKKELSETSETEITLPSLLTTSAESLGLQTTLSRSTFERITQDLAARLVEPIANVLASGDFDSATIDDILLIGGGSRLPDVQRTISQTVGRPVTPAANGTDLVALGATVESGVIHGDVDDIANLSLITRAIGTETHCGRFEPIIERNTTIPTKETKMFVTAIDDRTSLRIPIFQGESSIAAENEYCGELTLTDIPPASAGEQEVSEHIPREKRGDNHESTRQVVPEVIARVRRLVPPASRTGSSVSTHSQSVEEVDHTQSPLAERPGESVTGSGEHPPTDEQAETRQRCVKQLIPVRDSIAQALAHVSNSDIHNGIEAIARQLDDVFETMNVTVFSPAPGDTVDPHRHQVVATAESDVPARTVISVESPGYLMNQQVLRPARVVVSQK